MLIRLHRPRALLLGAAMWAAVGAPAQDPTLGVREWNRLSDDTGIERGTVRFPGAFQGSQTRFVIASMAHPRVRARLVVPIDGPNRAAGLGDLARQVNGVAAITLEGWPAVGDDFHAPGLRMAEGRIYTWPPVAAPHAVVLREGAIEIAEPAHLPGVVLIDSTTTLSLHSVNGALPPAAMSVSVYTGRISTGDLPAAQWPDGLAYVLLRPMEQGADPNELLTPNRNDAGLLVPRDRRFVPVRVMTRLSLQTSTGEALLVLQTPVPDAVMQRLAAAAPLEITATIDPTLARAEAIFPVGRQVVASGRLVDGVAGGLPLRNLLGIDRLGRRLMMMAPEEDRRGGAGIAIAELEAIARDEGFADLFDLGGGGPRFLPVVDGRRLTDRAAGESARFALVLTRERQVLRLAGQSGGLVRLQDWTIQGLRTEPILNQPAKLRDERWAWSSGADTFWAADVSGIPPGLDSASLLVYFPRVVRLGAFELIHASSAGFSPAFNLRHYRVWSRRTTRDGAAWTLLADVRHESPTPRDLIVLDSLPEVAELRIEIVAPSFVPGGSMARAAELILWGAPQ